MKPGADLRAQEFENENGKAAKNESPPLNCVRVLLQGALYMVIRVMIPLARVLMEMERCDGDGRPVPFSLEFVTADRKRKTGGEIVKIRQGVLNSASMRQLGQLSEKKDAATKAPNHWDNATRNVRVLANSQIKKVHIRLITKFNGMAVIY